MNSFPHRSRWQAGQATIEYLYVIPILLILLLGSLQFVFIYEAKQTLNYATFAGTRSGALNHGNMEAIKDGLAAGLAPLFVHDETQKALKDARRVAKTELDDSKLARIEIINPTPGALGGFQYVDPLDPDATPGIPNDNLMYRDPDAIKGGMNVQDANILKVRVTYCVRLIVPIVNRMVYAFTAAPPAKAEKIDSTYAGEKIAAPDMLKVSTGSGSAGSLCVSPDDTYPYRIPVTSEAVVRMQSTFKCPLPSGGGCAATWTAP